MYNRLFADISSNNDWFDAATYAAHGHLIIGNKVTEGTNYRNPTWAGRTVEAHRHKVAVLHYHFARPERGLAAADEARYFSRAVMRLWRPGDRLAIDLESGGGMPSHEMIPYQHLLAHLIHVETGHVPMLYTFAAFLQEYGRGLLSKGQRLWYADYNEDWKDPPATGGKWARQFTDGQRGFRPRMCAGIGPCDVSRLSIPAYLGLRRERLRRR